MLIFTILCLVFLICAVGYYGYLKVWLYKRYDEIYDYIPTNDLEYERQDAVLSILKEITDKML